MKNIAAKFIILSIILFSIISAFEKNKQVLAQAASPSVSPSASQTQKQIMQKERLTEDISQTKDELLSQLESYNRDEKKYRIALSQYQAHQTLSSIEDVVEISRLTMLSRNQVLTTYLKLIRLKLIETEGIEVTHKKEALTRIEQKLILLGQFKARIEPVNDRIEINQLADDFVEIGADIKEDCYYSLTLLMLGRLQGVYDQTNVLESRIKEGVVAENRLDKTLNEQAFKETDRLIESTQTMLAEQWSELGKDDLNSKYEAMYRRVYDDLNLIYTKLSQLVSYLGELLDQ
ncbi:MAG: hypothetical protein U9O78_00090 [Patescibacteria group bacterium]|nr:hypothetical protein [Patescibacteria group bacterium]